MMRSLSLSFALTLRAGRAARVIAIALAVTGGQAGAQAAAQGTATLTGTVRDSGGRGVADAEIILRESGNDLRSVRAIARGEFTLGGVQPGAYSVWFRRLGYVSVDYNWAAHLNEKSDVKVQLFPVAQNLNAVEVRAREDRMMKGNSSLLGLVVDDEGNPLAEAEVKLVGADREGTTRANGGFLFKPIPLGAYVVRVRKLGYSPTLVSMNVQGADDHEVIVRMRRLAQNLSAVTITERSGYTKTQFVYEDMERRMRWHYWKSNVLGPDDLKRYEGLDLPSVAKQLGVAFWERESAVRMNDRRHGPIKVTEVKSNCILINGLVQSNRDLSTYSVSDIDFLEVYPPGTELTGTIADRMHGPCASTSLFQHPTYYVLWEKGRKP